MVWKNFMAPTLFLLEIKPWSRGNFDELKPILSTTNEKLVIRESKENLKKVITLKKKKKIIKIKSLLNDITWFSSLTHWFSHTLPLVTSMHII